MFGAHFFSYVRFISTLKFEFCVRFIVLVNEDFNTISGVKLVYVTAIKDCHLRHKHRGLFLIGHTFILKSIRGTDVVATPL